MKKYDEALFYHSAYGPVFNYDLGLSSSDSDLNEYDLNGCVRRSYEKKIRKTEDDFSIEDYEVFQIVNKVLNVGGSEQ